MSQAQTMQTGGSGLAAAMRNPESEKIPDYPWFDWLRFVLASIVVLGHSDFQIAPQIGGGLAVDVFLVLSGWLIGSILLKMDRSELPRFYFNRATRIWIPYAIAIILLYGLAAARDGIDFYWFKYLLLDTTFTHTLYTFFPAASYELPLGGSGNQFWSISVEEQFYLLAPLIILYLPVGRTLWFWVIAALAALFGAVLFVPIAVGVAAAIVKSRTNFRLTRTLFAGIAAITVFLFFVMGTYPSKAANTLFALGVVLLCSGEGTRRDLAIFFGGLSFPLYLNHWIGVFAVHAFEKIVWNMPEPLVIASSYALNVAIAGVMYWIIDRQIQLRRRDFYSDRLGRRLMITGYALFAIGVIAGGAMHIYGPHGQSPISTQPTPAQPNHKG